MAMMCKKGSYNITEDCGSCPEDCPYGAWHRTPEGICGAECLECGGTLLLTDTDRVYCDSCGFQQEDTDINEL